LIDLTNSWATVFRTNIIAGKRQLQDHMDKHDDTSNTKQRIKYYLYYSIYSII